MIEITFDDVALTTAFRRRRSLTMAMTTNCAFERSFVSYSRDAHDTHYGIAFSAGISLDTTSVFVL
jgi:hypothetical protein